MIPAHSGWSGRLLVLMIPSQPEIMNYKFKQGQQKIVLNSCPMYMTVQSDINVRCYTFGI